MQYNDSRKTSAGIMTKQLKERQLIILEGLEGDLAIPAGAKTLVLFAHGSGSSKHSSRNHFVASILNKRAIATFVVNLLNQEERAIDADSKHLRYDIRLLARRFSAVTSWLAEYPETRNLDIGYFGSSTGAAAALITAERLGTAKAIVARGGRPDLVSENILHQVKAPTLFIVGGNDTPVITMNKRALESLSESGAKELAIIP
ncbi:MAG TPA: dienelactone hydrolase family protein, partial [Nitrososphaera sp.]|nr:dienelactone hydrolase family protein [Nitrososphaera sp.]